MKFFGSFFRLIIASLLFFGLVMEGYGQTVVSSFQSPDGCVITYNMSDDTVIVVFKCDALWTPPLGLQFLDDILVIGGGGGGGKRDDSGNRGAGGGGAGEVWYVSNTGSLSLDFNSPTPLNIVIGNGGQGSSSSSTRGGTGNPSSVTRTDNNNPFVNIIAQGGGGGGSANSSILGTPIAPTYDDQRRGGFGGSGGGSVGSYGPGASNPIPGGQPVPLGDGISRFSNAGGNGVGNNNVTG
ncbi:hypothetical protein BC751_1312 [Cecembia calidifontis]|uniref:Glycine-rich domain-containing protein n=1 Tax=Cecembia calidifontis TaxID=1187080 RepID=A0A4Q7P6X2_9BACT|nr:hypothetical protein [Cecembia calidifontis]RZS95771.1 hypothetical protein BC751_1312 [Cecembia calidifontis]